MLVVCLCAQWCQLCNAYRGTFEAVAARTAAHRFAFIDIEDEAALLGTVAAVNLVDVMDFPTLLIIDAQGLLFLGPITPQSQTLERLVLAASTSASFARPQPLVGLAALQPLIDGITERGLQTDASA